MATTKELEQMIDKIISMLATLAHIEDVDSLRATIKGAVVSERKIDLLIPKKNATKT